MDIVIFFNNTKKQLNFPGLPGAAGTAPTGTAKNNQDQIRGERPGPGGMFSNRDRDGSPQGAGRSAWSAKEEDSSWFAHLLENLLICARRWPCRYCWQRCYPLRHRPAGGP